MLNSKQKNSRKTQNRNGKLAAVCANNNHGYYYIIKKTKKSKQKTMTSSILELTSGTVEFFCAFLARRRTLALSYHRPTIFSKTSSVIYTTSPPIAIIVDCYISPTIFLWTKPPCAYSKRSIWRSLSVPGALLVFVNFLRICVRESRKHQDNTH